MSIIDLLVDDVQAVRHALSAARAARTAIEPACVAGESSPPEQKERARAMREVLQLQHDTVLRLEAELMLARKRLAHAQRGF